MQFEMLEQGDRPLQEFEDDCNAFTGELSAVGGMLQAATFFNNAGKHSVVFTWLDKEEVNALRMATGQSSLQLIR